MCLILDNQLAVDLIVNPKMLVNTRTVRYEDAIWFHCNSGAKVLNQVGKLPGYENVWYKPTWIDNILSMPRVNMKCRTR